MSIIEKAVRKLEEDFEPGQVAVEEAPPARERSRADSRAVPGGDVHTRGEPADAAPVGLMLRSSADSAIAAPAEVDADPQPEPEPAIGDLDQVPVEDRSDAPSFRADDLEQRTSKTVELDYRRLQSFGIITPDTADSLIAEEHRHIKRPLLMNAALDGEHRVPRGNLILVTSSLPGEGKTFTSVNMALSTAMELDRTVLLVDTDCYKSDVGGIFGIEAQEGLTDYLAEPDARPLSQFLVKTDMRNLMVLPAGSRTRNVTELFSSAAMVKLMEELSTRYRDRVVIFDSAPLLATTGSQILSHLVGQVVMVVEAVRTPRSAIAESLRMLEHLDYVGMVLNKSRERPRRGYKYGYGYGHGRGDRGRLA